MNFLSKRLIPLIHTFSVAAERFFLAYIIIVLTLFFIFLWISIGKSVYERSETQQTLYRIAPMLVEPSHCVKVTWREEGSKIDDEGFTKLVLKNECEFSVILEEIGIQLRSNFFPFEKQVHFDPLGERDFEFIYSEEELGAGLPYYK